MSELGTVARLLIYAGILLVAAGLGLLLVGRVPGVGRLPGDILIRKGNFTFYFPIVTSILISLILTLLFRLFRR